jgi:pimeloyl-ACP methyl ester carboxylesterase
LLSPTTVVPAATIESCLKRVTAPTLLLWGEDDRIFPSRWAHRLSRDLGGAQVRIIPGCGHSPAEERPKDFVSAVEPFVSLPSEETRRRAV